MRRNRHYGHDDHQYCAGRCWYDLGGATFITQLSIVVLSVVSNMMLAKYGAMSKYGQDIPISVFSIQSKVYTVVCNIVVGIVLGGQPIFGFNNFLFS